MVKSNNLENKYLCSTSRNIPLVYLQPVFMVMRFVFMPSELDPENDTFSNLQTNASVLAVGS